MSEPIKTTSELINKYADILDTIFRMKTQGSYTYHGVLGNFLNEWLEMDRSEEDDEAGGEDQSSVELRRSGDHAGVQQAERGPA